MADSLNERVSTLEEAMRRAFTAIEALAEKEAKLDDALATLIESQIQMQQEQIKTEQRFRQTDERIEKLVIAMGEFLRRN
jgi:chromosome segregation ATPase